MLMVLSSWHFNCEGSLDQLYTTSAEWLPTFGTS